MSEHYGVRCHNRTIGDHPIILADYEPDMGREVAFYTVPSDTILCPTCGLKDTYAPSEGDFIRRVEAIPTDAAAE